MVRRYYLHSAQSVPGFAVRRFAFRLMMGMSAAFLLAFATPGAVFADTSDEGYLAKVVRLTSGNPTTAGLGGNFGHAVAIDGDHALVSAHIEPHNVTERGAVYYFRRVNGNWQLQQKILPPGSGNNWAFGATIIIRGDMALIGSLGGLSSPDREYDGAVHVYQLSGNIWTLTQVMESPNPLGNPAVGIGSAFGGRMALDGDRLAISAYYYDFSNGAVFFYERDTQTGNWVYTDQVLTSGVNGALFGTALALQGNNLLVGVASEGEPDYEGAAYHYRLIDRDWTLIDRFEGEVYFGAFGEDVALAGEWAALTESLPQRVHLYRLNRGRYEPYTVVNIPDTVPGNGFFGRNVYLTTDMMIVSAPNQSGERGALYLFTREGDDWVWRDKFTNTSTTESQRFGNSFAVSSQDVLIGAPLEGSNAGAGYIFRFQPRYADTLNGAPIALSGIQGSNPVGSFGIRNEGMPGTELDVSLVSISPGYSVNGLPFGRLGAGNQAIVNVGCEVGVSASAGALVVQTNESGAAIQTYILTCQGDVAGIQPGDYDLLSPQDGGSLVSPDLLNPIRWSALPGATQYTVIVSRVSTNARYGVLISETRNAGAVCSGGTCQINLSADQLASLSAGQYSWTVLANTPGGGFEAQNAPYGFMIEGENPYGIVRNGGFEQKNTNGNPVLGAWRGQQLIPADQIICNRVNHPTQPDRIVAYEGDCAFRFKGSQATKSRLIQNLTGNALPPLNVGDWLLLSAAIDVNRSTVRPVRVIIFYTDGSSEKLDLIVDEKTDGYEVFTNSLEIRAPVERLRFLLRYPLVNGRAFIDDVRLIITSAPPDDPDSAGGVLPLPPPPPDDEMPHREPRDIEDGDPREWRQ